MYVIMKLTSSIRSEYSLSKVDSNLTWLGYAERNESVDWVATPNLALKSLPRMQLVPSLKKDYGSIFNWGTNISIHSIYDDQLNDVSDQYPEYLI